MHDQYPEIFQLSVPEKLKLVEELWDSILEDPSQIPVPEWHIEELERRNLELEKNPDVAIPLEEAMKQLRSQLRRND